MNADVRHFVITRDGRVREFSAEQAALVAAGVNPLPEFASDRLRYLQITVDTGNGEQIKVQTGSACLRFDDHGRFAGAEAPAHDDDRINPFEYDACIQWALSKVAENVAVTFH